MDERTVSVDVTLTYEDVYNFQKSFLFKRFPIIKIILFFVFFIGVGGFLLIDSLNNGASPMPGLILLIIPVCFVIFIPLQLKKSAKAAIDTSKLLKKDQHYAINGEGIKAITESSEMRLKWDELYKAIESKDSFQFFTSKQQAYMIPKRYFKNEEELELVRNLIKRVPLPKDEKKRALFSLGKGFIFYVLLFFIIFFVLLLTGTKK